MHVVFLFFFSLNNALSFFNFSSPLTMLYPFISLGMWLIPNKIYLFIFAWNQIGC